MLLEAEHRHCSDTDKLKDHGDNAIRRLAQFQMLTSWNVI